jgi:peptide/nickel transport system substrate-binding protein
MLQTAGSYDPAAGVGVAFRYASQSPFSGVHDKKLDGMLGQAAGTLDSGQRKSLYDQAAKYMNDEAYSPFLFAFAPANAVDARACRARPHDGADGVVVTPSVLYDEVS